MHDFDVRTFPDHRQEILELADRDLERLGAGRSSSSRRCTTSTRTTRRSPPRACARSSGRRSSGYEIPWNNFDFAYQAYFSLSAAHIERKVAALAKYASQQHRRYANAEYVRNLARTHGINVNREYAEVARWSVLRETTSISNQT